MAYDSYSMMSGMYMCSGVQKQGKICTCTKSSYTGFISIFSLATRPHKKGPSTHHLHMCRYLIFCVFFGG